MLNRLLIIAALCSMQPYAINAKPSSDPIQRRVNELLVPYAKASSSDSGMPTTMGDTVKEAKRLEALLKDNPDDLQARYSLGILYHQLGRNVEATEELDKAIAARPEEITYLAKIIVCLDSKRDDKAKRTLDEMLKIWPTSEFGLTFRGDLYYSDDQDNEGAKCYEKAGLLGMLHYASRSMKDDPQKAEEILGKALDSWYSGDYEFQLVVAIGDKEMVLTKQTENPFTAISLILGKVKYVAAKDLKGMRKEFLSKFPPSEQKRGEQLFEPYSMEGGLQLKVQKSVTIWKNNANPIGRTVYQNIEF